MTHLSNLVNFQRPRGRSRRLLLLFSMVEELLLLEPLCTILLTVSIWLAFGLLSGPSASFFCLLLGLFYFFCCLTPWPPPPRRCRRCQKVKVRGTF